MDLYIAPPFARNTAPFNKEAPRRTPWFLLLLLSLTLFHYKRADGAIVAAASCNTVDVQAAFNRAQAGDTVLLPPGTANWTQGATWNAPPNVTIKGAGTLATGGGDQTIIIDNISNGSALLAFNVAPTGVFRVTGITIKSGTGSVKDGGTVSIYGPGLVRLDHIHFAMSSGANYKVLVIGSGVFGVLDRSILDFNGTNAIYVYNGRCGSGDWMGNLEWSLPTNFGGPDYFFIEDNIINGNVSGGTYSSRIFDGFTAAKVVVRFNDVSQAVLGETHATGHSGDDRGLRSQEVYCNKVTSSLTYAPNYCALDMGNGTALVWGNTWGNVYKNLYLFKQTRKNNSTYRQSPTPDGWGYAGTQYSGLGSMWDGGTAQGTDTASGYPCLDQPGRGQGDLLVGGFPNKINRRTGTLTWPNQALEPIYIWNNTGGIVSGWGGTAYSDDSGGRVAANRDYYPAASGPQDSPNSPFDGSSGTGWGTLANRPTNCKTGVAYFAVDQGSWNKTTSNPYGVQLNGASGVLYKCTATNTWTPYYEPHPYPHPLRLPAAPTALRATN